MAKGKLPVYYLYLQAFHDVEAFFVEDGVEGCGAGGVHYHGHFGAGGFCDDGVGYNANIGNQANQLD